MSRIFAVLSLVFVVGCRDSRLESLEQRTAALEESVATMRQASQFGLQSECAAEAADFFKQHTGGKISTASYQSHWNSRVGHCFVEIFDKANGLDQLPRNRKDVFDVAEGKHYGSFVGTIGPSPSVEDCATSKLGERDTHPDLCRSEAEFDVFVRSYMD